MEIATRTPDEEAKRNAHFSVLMDIYGRTDSILSGKSITASLDKSGGAYGAPAYSTNRDVFFNADMIGELHEPETLIALSGLNYHELCHLMWTPKRGDAVYKTLSQPSGALSKARGQEAFNILEDMRIESMLVAKWPATRYYLMTTAVKYLLSPDQNFGTVFALVAGRRYLGKKLMRKLAEMFVRQDLVQDFNECASAYRSLDVYAHPYDANRLIDRYAALLRLAMENENHPSEYKHQAPMQVMASSDSRATPKSSQNEQKELAEKAKSEGANDGDPDEDSTPGQEDDQDKEAGGNQPGHGEGDHTGLDEILSKTMDAAMSSTEVMNDVRQKQSAMRKAGVMPKDLIRFEDKWRGRQLPPKVAVTPDMHQALRIFTKSMKKIVEDADPGWDKRHATGRLNIQRAMHDGNDLDTAFDDWRQGKSDTTSIEFVFLLDYSGSMHEDTGELGKAAWIVKSACSAIGVGCTVIAYEAHSVVLYGHDEKLSKSEYQTITSAGGTDPHGAILAAYNTFVASRRKAKILLVMTDGAWSLGGSSFTSNPGLGITDCDDAIAKMNKMGVTTAQWYLDSNSCLPAGSIEWHNTIVHHIGTDIAGLAKFAHKLVETAMKRSK